MSLQNMSDMTREIMNAVGSTQWSDSTLQTWVGMAHWAEWADILNINPAFYMQAVTTTQDSNGQFLLSALDTGSGDTALWHYRIKTISQPASPAAQVQYYYRQSSYEMFPNPQPNTSLPYIWYRLGTKIQILPISSGQQMSVMVTYRPTRADQLSSPSVTVDFPSGYEQVIPWRAATLGLVKGGSETQAANDIRVQYQILHDAMLADLGRDAGWPIIARAFDDPSDWSG